MFGGLARIRGDRALHPHGTVLEATFTPAPAGAPVLGAGRRALVRFSRGAGLPEPLPDVLGCAVRVLDAHGDGRHQDLLMASSFVFPLGRHLLVPGRDFGRAFYSSVLVYEIGGRPMLPAPGSPAPQAARSPRSSAPSPPGAWLCSC